ncbi:MAG: PA14 domain-containing protein [Planctomycetota bacterium]
MRTTGWVFYRRFTGGDPINEGKTRAVIKGDAAAALAAEFGDDPSLLLDHVTTLTDAEFDELASATYTYDTEGRANGYTKGACCGSAPSATAYTYSTQSGGELDRWLQKSVTDDRPGENDPGEVRTRYINPNGTVLLAIDEWYDGQGGVERAVTVKEVDASGRVVKIVSPEAVALAGAYVGNADGTVGSIPLHPGEGRIVTRTYDAAPADGLRGQYYENASFSGTPSFERVDGSVAMDWEYADPWAWASVDELEDDFETFPDWDETNDELVYPVADKDFSVRWAGTVRAPEAGEYVFHLASDDAVKLTINGADVIDEAAGGDGFYESSAVTLAAGAVVPVVLEYAHTATASADDREPAGVSLFWTKPGATAMTPIDNDVQFSGEGRGGAMLSESVQRGGSGTPVMLKSYEYYSPHAWEPNYLPGTHLYNRAKTKIRYGGEPGALVEEKTTIEYRDENGGTAGYFFHDDAVDPAAGGNGWHPKYVVTRRSLGGSDELVTRETRDVDGRTVFRQGPDGVIHYYEHLDTAGLDAGRMSVHVADYDPSQPLPPGVTVPALPGGFTVTPGLHENRVTKYQVSPVSGETVRVSEYKGPTLLTETAYLTRTRSGTAAEYPGHKESRVYSEIYSDNGIIKTARPIQVTISEPGGNTVSTQTAVLTSWAGTSGIPDAGDGLQLISRTDYVYDPQGRQTGTLVYDAYDGSGNLVLKNWTDADAITRHVVYDHEGEVKSQEDPLAKKTFFTDGYVSTGLNSPFRGVVMERRTYPHNKASGPIRVTWTDILGRTVRTFGAMTSAADWSGADPTGDEPLTELTRSTSFYDWQGRTEKQRAYFDLTGLTINQEGTPEDGDPTTSNHYYESEYLAYDNQGRVLRMRSASGDISATVYDAAGRAVERWVGTDDSGATAADPGAGSGNLVMVSETLYGDGQGQPGNRVVAQRRLKPGLVSLSGTSSDYITDATEYDSLGRMIWSKPDVDLAAGQGNPWIHSEYDVRGNLWRSTTYKHGSTPDPTNMLARSESVFDAAGRIIESRTYEVLPSPNGPTGNYLSSTYAYDRAGRQYLSQSSGAGFTKSRYDAAGRMIRSWSGTTPVNETDSDPDGDDIVVSETVYGYDAADNVIWTEVYSRRHDTPGSSTGLLSDLPGAADVRYSATWYDDAHRPTHVVDYGDESP